VKGKENLDKKQMLATLCVGTFVLGEATRVLLLQRVRW
jgi:hypothetical protein